MDKVMNFIVNNGTDQIMSIRVPIDIVPSSLARLNCA
jgi:hypothetical protein